MSVTWNGVAPDPPRPLGTGDWLRIGVRGAAIVILLILLFPLLLLLRVPERWIVGVKRPVTPWITQSFFRLTCAVLGLRLVPTGTVDKGPGALVCNHISWLDILVLNACTRAFFVAKSEVRGWPGIGALARGAGTLFIARDRARAAEQTRILQDRLAARHRLLIFPEGTSTDGLRVLDFRTTLFAAFYADGLPDDLSVQPVSLIYTSPQGEPASFYGWWGDAVLVPNLLKVLAAPRQGVAQVIFHPPIRVADQPGRKALALAAQTAVRDGFVKAHPLGVDGAGD